ncbi:MAG: Hint domain-containing protein [Cypionkella sp.]
MDTGSSGTFVISWSQTETDGVKCASLDILAVGASWRWSGVPVRLDGPQDMLRLDGAEGVAEMRRRAARIVRRLIGAAVGQGKAETPDQEDDPASAELADQSFVVTDGHETYTVTLLTVPDTGAMLLMMVAAMPPPDQDLWVVRVSIDRSKIAPVGGRAGGVICFTPGTRIATQQGLRLVQDLQQGDLVLTRDNGAQPVLWTGHRRMSGARLYAMPNLRPIRFRSGAMGPERPDPDLLVSPQHRMLLRGRAAQALFNTDEVLVAAEDLVNDTTITVDRTAHEVTYVHALLEHHNVIWANGLETESFHPANAALESVEPLQREGLLSLFPQLMLNPHTYGDYARRNLSSSEAAILRHDMNI